MNIRATPLYGRATRPQFSTASAFSSSLLVRAAEPSFRIFSHSRDAAFLHRVVLGFRSFHSSRPKSEISASLFSITCTLFLTPCKRVKRYLHSFLPLPHSLQKYPGIGVPLYSGAARHSRLGTNSRPISTGLWSLIINVFLSSHRYFRISFEKPYPQTYHPMAKRYRTGCILRVFGFLGFRVCLTNPEKSKLYYAAWS